MFVREILGPDGRRPGLAVHAEPHVQQRDRIALREVVGIEPRRTDDLDIRAHERAQPAAQGMAVLQTHVGRVRDTKGASLPTSLAARLDSLMSLSVKPSPT